MNETINFLSNEFYRGSTRGFEIAIVDLAVLSLFFITFIKKPLKEISFFPRGSIIYGIYFLCSLISLSNSDKLVYSGFEVLKMIRMFFYFWTLANYIDNKEKIYSLIKNILITIAYIFICIIYDKYFLGIFQNKGPFPHQNSLVMYMIVFGTIIFNFFMSQKKNYMIYGLFSAISLIIIISTLSRAGLVCFLFSLGLSAFFQFLFRSEKHKFYKSFLLLLGALLILVKASDSIIERFNTAPKESAEVRVLLASIALKMADDKTFGVGLNNFGLKVNYPYKYAKGTPNYLNPDFRGGLVETVYLMIAAECGWPTLVVFVIMLLYLLLRIFIRIFKEKDQELWALSVAITCALLGIYLESTLEWVLKQTTNFYQFMLIYALVSSLPKISRKCSTLKQKRGNNYGTKTAT